MYAKKIERIAGLAPIKTNLDYCHKQVKRKDIIFYERLFTNILHVDKMTLIADRF